MPIKHGALHSLLRPAVLLALEYEFEEKAALANREIDICDRIRRKRRPGNTRCGVVAGRMTVADAARAFGLADDDTIYRTIGGMEAQEIATRVLSADLAYGSTIMSISDAADLWRQFVALFDGQNVEFFSNAAAIPNAWTPATPATFDMGVLVVGADKAGCLWVEDED
ncbi:hypothetical protein [Bradyrhizobium sp. 170]|uniref:hypothetical protein n=1 Tax=Bradyrhizobium sp. 170 TaxID=2782641 RepID=UPI001FFEFA22|nr:hypothetical protein [Bradyrhizobium sp. 170]UPK03590.1 hypothetical protein IVB05_39885 [Bradyrhizobium sp. 170]